jgi:hypothetical protein
MYDGFPCEIIIGRVSSKQLTNEVAVNERIHKAVAKILSITITLTTNVVQIAKMTRTLSEKILQNPVREDWQTIYYLLVSRKVDLLELRHFIPTVLKFCGSAGPASSRDTLILFFADSRIDMSIYSHLLSGLRKDVLDLF